MKGLLNSSSDFQSYYIYNPFPICYSYPTFQQPFYFINLQQPYSSKTSTPSQQPLFLQQNYQQNNVNKQLTPYPTIPCPIINQQVPVLQTQNVQKQLSKNNKINQIKHLSLIKSQNVNIYEQSLQQTTKNSNDRFIKKNTESNIINQIFSFLWTPEKSEAYLRRVLGQRSKIQSFYRLMWTIKINCKSKLNRFFLKELMTEEGWVNGMKKFKKRAKKLQQISYQDLIKSIRILVSLYLRDISRFSIMTSKKMNHQLWGLHFRKRQEVFGFLFQQGSTEQAEKE